MKFPPLVGTPDLTIESQSRPYAGRFAVDVVKFRNRRFDGSMSGVRTWELFRRGRAAAVLPYDPWTDQVVLMEQFRLPALAAGLDPVMMEVPAGLCEGGETPEQTVRREIREEIALETDALLPMVDVVLTPGGSDERCTLFAGRVHAPPAGPDGIAGTAGLASEEEDIRARVLPADLAIERALGGAYANSVTVIALLWLAAKRQQVRAEWQA